jgi:hypothetical protein
LEFITRYRRRDVRYAYGLGGALTAKYNHDVVTILFVLKQPSRTAENLGQYDLAPFGHVLNRHDFSVVKLWELRDEILKGKKEYLGLVPLLPEISARVDKDLLKRQRELINLVKNPVRRAEIAFYTVAFNEPYFGQKFLWNYFAEYKNMLTFEDVKHVPIFGELLKKGIEEGVKEKTKEAEAKAKEAETKAKEAETKVKKRLILNLRENIIDLLTTRFGHVNGKTARLINSIEEPRILRTIFRRALKAQSLDTVKEMLEAKKQTLRKKAA